MNLRKGALSLAVMFDDLPYTFLNVSTDQAQVACEAEHPLSQAHVLNLQMYLERLGLQITAHATGFTLRRSQARNLNQVTDAQWEAHQTRMAGFSTVELERVERRLKA